MKVLQLLILFICILFLNGCSHNESNAPLLRNPISYSELAGRWTISPKSLDLLSSYVQTPVTNSGFVMEADGKILATNFPLDVGSFKSEFDLITGVGKWKIEKRYSVYIVDVILKNHGNDLNIRKYGGDIILTSTIDDPDSGRVLVFERLKR